jgi:hypothetical protein
MAAELDRHVWVLDSAGVSAITAEASAINPAKLLSNFGHSSLSER